MKTDNIMIDELNPYVRKVGKQGFGEWKNNYRKIYDYEWMYCIKGEAYYETKDTTHKLKRGTLLLIKPNVPHKFWVDRGTKAENIWVHFDFKYRKDVYELDTYVKNNQSSYFQEELPQKNYLRQEYTINNTFILPEIIQIKNKDYIEARYMDILDAFVKHNATWQLMSKANLLLIIKDVLNQIEDDNYFKSFNTVDLPKRIKNYIDEYYFRKITRKEISKYLGYNEDYLGKTFKNKYGCSISAYSNFVKIEKAKEMLDKTDLLITNISELLGFNDVYYFCKTMKKITGYSPAGWRKRIRRMDY
ncbi:AraC family transcriptional regulator [Vallitalea guaymasensis]|uniref:AraC family transcriptional regulator n=1 Tax=Vallitalea guaymasensis TaxID=1185412 RepID=UPI0023564561|nr:AraC family transcriptional regulator [Vallitalea guaymasensis]